MIIFAILAVIFVALGILFSFGKGAFLIAGYNTASEEKKSQINKENLMFVMGVAMFCYAICMLICGFGMCSQNYIFIWIGMGLFALTTVATLIIANGKYVKNR